MHGMRVMAPAGPDTFIRRPNQVQNLRGWTPARGKDAAMKAPHPVRWSHNTRTARRRVRCGGRDRPKRDTEYPGECRREHISFPCVPPWLGKRRVPYLSEPPQDCQAGSHFLYGGSRSRRTNNNDPSFYSQAVGKKRRDTVGQPPSAEIWVSKMPSWKAKKLRKLLQEKVLLER